MGKITLKSNGSSYSYHDATRATNVATLTKGTNISVFQKDGGFKLATVLDKRLVNRLNRNISDKSKYTQRRSRRNSLNSEGALYEFYVHYKNEDKRLDEWVESKQIQLLASSTGAMQQNAYKPRRRLISNNNNNNNSNIKYRIRRRRQCNQNSSMSSNNNIPTKENYGNNGSSTSTSRNRPNDNSGSNYSPYNLDGKVKEKNIKSIRIGHYLIDTWYYSPVPGFENHQMNKLYFDEMTMRYFSTKTAFEAAKKEGRLSPPGLEVYRDLERGISLFEVDGAVNKIFCQGLCLLSKMFLDHKTIYFDTSPFKFYVLCEHEILHRTVDFTSNNICATTTRTTSAIKRVEKVLMHHPVGYFSKEKESAERYNLACLCTFPPHQRKGYGKLLISFSYAFSIHEKTPGAPEKPLSDLGWLSYESFWRWWLLNSLKELIERKRIPLIEGKIIKVRVKTLVKLTGMLADDIIETSSRLGILTEGLGDSNDEGDSADNNDMVEHTTKNYFRDYESVDEEENSKVRYIGFTPVSIARIIRKHVERKTVNVCKMDLLKFQGVFYNDNRFFQRIRSPA